MTPHPYTVVLSLQCSRAQVTMLALALPREVVEIEVPDNSMLVESGSTENMSDMAGPAYSPKRT